MNGGESGSGDSGRGAPTSLVDIFAWTAFALVITAAVWVSFLTIRQMNADYRVLRDAIS